MKQRAFFISVIAILGLFDIAGFVCFTSRVHNHSVGLGSDHAAEYRDQLDRANGAITELRDSLAQSRDDTRLVIEHNLAARELIAGVQEGLADNVRDIRGAIEVLQRVGRALREVDAALQVDLPGWDNYSINSGDGGHSGVDHVGYK